MGKRGKYKKNREEDKGSVKPMKTPKPEKPYLSNPYSPLSCSDDDDNNVPPPDVRTRQTRTSHGYN